MLIVPFHKERAICNKTKEIKMTKIIFRNKMNRKALLGAAVGVGLAVSAQAPAFAYCGSYNPCRAKKSTYNSYNPCSAKNPCASHNPCAAKNPCASHNPCAAKNPCASYNPCAAKHPCGAKHK